MYRHFYKTRWTEQNLIKKYDDVCGEIILPSDVILNDDFITEVENIYKDLEEKKN